MAEAKMSLEPMNVWDILDGSARLYRRHFWTMAGTSVLLALVGYVIWWLYIVFAQSVVELPVPGSLPSADAIPGVLCLSLGALLIGVSLGFIHAGVLAVLVNDAYLDGHASLGSALKKLRLRSLIVACFLATCLISVGCVLLLVPGIYLVINFTLVPVVAAIERRRPLGALKRSWTLVRARMARGFWNNNITRIMVIWAFLLVLGLLAVAIQGAVMGVAWKLSQAPKDADLRTAIRQMLRLPAWIRIGMGLFGVVVEAFFRPFAVCALVLLYYDIRVKKEGVDIGMTLDRMAPAPGPGVRAEAGDGND